jgi:hypothetical protein
MPNFRPFKRSINLFLLHFITVTVRLFLLSSHFPVDAKVERSLYVFATVWNQLKAQFKV